MLRARRLIFVSIAAVAVALAVSSALRVAVVTGNSMAPTFHDGQVVLVLASRWVRSGPRRGAVALIRHGGDVLIKRIAYVPGDVIRSPDSLALSRFSLFFDRAPGRYPQGDRRLRVPPGEVVVLGDNRSISDDSRTFGPVPISDIIGYAL